MPFGKCLVGYRNAIFLLFGFSCLCGTTLYSQNHESGNSSTQLPYQLKQYRLQDGLPDNFVNTLLQDRYGFIWLGTSDGLGRFDGIHFHTFRHRAGDTSSLSSNKINAILEDKQGFIWVATDRGLSRYDSGTESFLNFRHDPGNVKSISHDHIRAIYEDSQGVIWAGAFNGLNRYDSGKNSFTVYHHENQEIPPWNKKPSQEVSAISETVDGQLIIGYWGNGAMLFDRSTKRFKDLLGVEYFPRGKSLVIESISIDDNQNNLICAQGRLFMYNKNGLKQITGIKPDHLAVSLALQSGQYVTGGEGITLRNESFKEIQHIVPDTTPVDFSQNFVLSLIQDKAGDIWFGTMGGGLYTLSKASKSFLNIQMRNTQINSLHDNFIKALLEVEEDMIWVGGRRAGIKIFDRKNNTFKSLPPHIDFPGGLKTKEISELYQDKRDNIWIGTWGRGLHLYRPSTQSFQYFLRDFTDSTSICDNFVTAILETSEGEMWVGTTLGLCILFTEEDVSKSHFAQYRYNPEKTGGLNHQNVSCLYQSKSGVVWVGTLNGLHRYNRQTNTFTLYRHEPGNPASLSNNTIKCIFEDSKGRLWIGTAGGLELFDSQTNTFQHIHNIGPLSDGIISGIQEDEKGSLWIATKLGISRFDPMNMTVKHYDARDGFDNHSIISQAFINSAYSGIVYAGGRNGLSYFEPDKIQDNNHTYPVLITGLIKYGSHNGKSTESQVKGMVGKTQINLSHWENIITFELSALNFRNAEKNQFAYRLLGFNNNWINIGTKREITFTNLNAGTYTLQVKSANNDGIWYETPTELSIVVHPHWLRTWWAYSFYTLFILVIAYSIRRYTLKRQRLAHQLETEQLEGARLKELDAFKTRLYTNLTHEFRTPLTVILGMINQIRNEPKKYLHEGVRLIENNGQNLLRIINQLLDLSKLENKAFQLHMEQSDIVSYVRYVTESFQTYANSKNLLLRFFSTTESFMMDYDPEQIKHILINLISNAVKFTPSGGEIIVSVDIVNKSKTNHEFNGKSKLSEPKTKSIYVLPQVKQDSSRECLQICVADTGAGIDPENLPHIFDRFYQVDGSHTRAGEGTGIGLAHVLELVKIMGGQIQAESDVGKGTTFKISLPVTRIAPENNDILPPVAGPSFGVLHEQTVNAEEKSLSLPLLLIIEDNSDVVVYLKSCLDKLYQIEVAYNGKIGIEKALEIIPDLIISDVMMPEKDGYEVCRELKNDDRSSHIPIILLTAKADGDSKITGLRRGADAYLTKPFDKEELLVRLEMMREHQKRMVAYFSKNLIQESSETETTEDSIYSENAFLQKVRQIVSENFSNDDFGLPQLCHKIGMSRSQLFRKMQALSNTSPSDFIRSYRLQKAKTLFETTDMNVSEVAFQVGFKAPGYFSKLFQQEFGYLPSATSK